MYRAPYARCDDISTLVEVISANGLATLVSTAAGQLQVSHLPLIWQAAGSLGDGGGLGVLRGHLSRDNPHWTLWSEATPTVAVFHGPHSYISAAWYAQKELVPTWNYIVVHAHGRPRAIDDRKQSWAILRDTVSHYERQRLQAQAGSLRSPTPDVRPPLASEPAKADDAWRMRSQRRDFLLELERELVCFEMPIERLEGSLKLSQNRDAVDALSVMSELTKGDDQQQLLARWMRRVRGLS